MSKEINPIRSTRRITVAYRAGAEIQVTFHQGAYYLRTPQAMSLRGRDWRPIATTRGYLRQMAEIVIRGRLFPI